MWSAVQSGRIWWIVRKITVGPVRRLIAACVRIPCSIPNGFHQTGFITGENGSVRVMPAGSIGACETGHSRGAPAEARHSLRMPSNGWAVIWLLKNRDQSLNNLSSPQTRPFGQATRGSFNLLNSVSVPRIRLLIRLLATALAAGFRSRRTGCSLLSDQLLSQFLRIGDIFLVAVRINPNVWSLGVG